MSAALRPSPSPVVHRSPVLLYDYFVALPRPLLADIRNNPLAIGIYALIARVFRATKQPVPLSPADIRAYDPTISPTRAGRALDRLVDAGFLVIVPSEGRRNTYQPTWGRVSGEPRLWDLDARLIDRPRHIAIQPLPQALLDYYIGRLEPHATHGANVTRYITQPLLSLVDLGAYALLAAGYPAQSDTLSSYGLVRAGQVQPPPSLQEILALVTQRRLFDAESPIALTPAGWAKLGFAAPAPVEPAGEALLFVPPGQQIQPYPASYPQSHPDSLAHHHSHSDAYPTPYLIGQSIGLRAEEGEDFTACQCAESASSSISARSHGISCRDGENYHHPTPGSASPSNGGGGDSFSIHTNNQQPPTGQAPTRKAQPTLVENSARAALLSVEPAARAKPKKELPAAHVAAPAAVESSARADAPAAVESSARADAPPAPNKSQALLRELGVRHDVAAQLADRQPEQVARVIAAARDQKDVRNIAAWVVSALRALPADEPPPPSTPVKVSNKAILLHRGITNQQRNVWLARFRNATPTDQPAVLARFRKEHPPETDIPLHDEPYGPAY